MSSRWVLYLRLSVSDDASTSIARQERDGRARVAREGGEVVAVLVDDGLSGGKRRAKADAALSMLSSDEADVLWVWALDRWTRQGLAGLPELLQVLDQRPGKRFTTETDGLDSRNADTWEIQLGVSAWAAKRERANIVKRVRSSIAELRRTRRWSGGAVPYGYATAPVPDGPGRILVIDHDEKAIVDELADRLLNGEPVWRLARELTDRGVPTARSERRRLAREGREGGDPGQWRPTSLRKIMTGDALRGRQSHNGDVIRGQDGLPAEVWPPVLDEDRWSQLRALLAPEEGFKRPQRRRAARLLSGVVFCAECGHKMYVRGDKLSRGGAVYGCPAKRLGGVCDEVRISAGSLEDHVIGRVLALVGDWPLMRREEHVTEQRSTSLGDVEEAIRRTTAALAEDGADMDDLLRRLEALKTRRTEIRATPAVREVRMVPTGKSYREAFEEAQRSIDAARNTGRQASDDEAKRRALAEEQRATDEQRVLISDVVLGVRVRKPLVKSGKFDSRRVLIDGPEGIFDVAEETAA